MAIRPRIAWACASAFCTVAPRVSAAAAGTPGSTPTDIRGPLGPLPYPADVTRLPLWAALAGAAAVGLAALAVAHAVRARRRAGARRGSGPDGRAAELRRLEDAAERLPAGEFYERLLGIIRAALRADGDAGAESRTPRELARADVPERLTARWAELCGRAEAAEYAGADVAARARRDDLACAEELLAFRAEGDGRAL